MKRIRFFEIRAFWVWGLGLRVQSLGFRVRLGLNGFKVQGFQGDLL